MFILLSLRPSGSSLHQVLLCMNLGPDCCTLADGLSMKSSQRKAEPRKGKKRSYSTWIMPALKLVLS